MRSDYKPIGKYVRQVSLRNNDFRGLELKGIRINKEFMPSVANVTGTDLSKYKVVQKHQFAFNPMHVGRDEILPVSMLEADEDIIVSPAYIVFEIIDKNELDPEYLMMWCRRPEFDRNAWFTTDSSVRGGFSWDAFCEMELPVPSIEKQREIVKEYNTIINRIKLNEQLNQKLEETAQAIYKQWFVDFEFPISEEYANSIGKIDLVGKPYKSNGGEMVFNKELEQDIPIGWEYGSLSNIVKITMGQSPCGSSYNQIGNGEIFYQGRAEFGYRYPTVKTYTTQPKRMASKNDILMSVRAPVGDINIAAEDCCIGRGLAALKNLKKQNSFLLYLMLNIRPMFDVSNDEGTIFGSINKDTFNSLPILIPKDDIVDLFQHKIEKVDNVISLKCKEINKLLQFRDLLFVCMASKQLEAML